MKWSLGTVAAVLVTLAFAFGDEASRTLDYEVVSVKRLLLLLTGEAEQELQAGATAHSGDSLRTGSRSKAELTVAEANARFSIGAKTTFTLAHDQPGVLLAIERGSLRAIFGKLPEGNTMERLVTTPSAVLAVRGTEYGVEVEKDGDTSIAVFEGTVDVWEPGDADRRIQVRAGQSTRIRRGKPPTRPRPHGLSPNDWDAGRRRIGSTTGGSQQAPGTSSGRSQQGKSGSRSSSSQGGSKRHGG
jgi:hypothetical protein